MSNLGCSVHSCGNNCSGLCCLSSIDVTGGSATSSSETSCRSYRPASGTTNSTEDPAASPSTNISCKASNCKHNDNCRCSASRVTIDNCGCGNGAGCQTFEK
ncbi:DUF1540 domain-containing protein [Oscillibacter ruminantium]|uniref:DUF1540 domain-containing protein n=1 Tax=Oscillibacter ruminantium TaxID=1263547 RepID=UPI003A520F99